VGGIFLASNNICGKLQVNQAPVIVSSGDLSVFILFSVARVYRLPDPPIHHYCYMKKLNPVLPISSQN
jgi:hypothetical protein